MANNFQQFGIYLNTTDGKAVRITSPYWIPPASDWVLVTTEVNETMVRIRELVQEQNLLSTPQRISWGQIPSHG